MAVIIFNGRSSQDYHIQVEHPPGYETPERDYDITHVPGRNGDVIIDKGSYKNVDRVYEIAAGSLGGDFTEFANQISEWLHSASAYARLEDSFEPDYYRLAIYEERGDIENILGQAARTEITFNCKPQRFLKVGDDSVSVNSGGRVTNPTGFTALPIITVKINERESGVLKVGSTTVTISAKTSDIDYLRDSNGDYILDSSGNKIQETNILLLVLDSEIQDAYIGTENANSLITLNSGRFPNLVSGSNVITFSGGITLVEVVPKWWTL